MAELGGLQVAFQFQLGLIKDKVVVDSTDLTLKSMKTLACDFIGEKFPEHGITRLGERLMLFRHDYNTTNTLQVIEHPSDIGVNKATLFYKGK